MDPDADVGSRPARWVLRVTLFATAATIVGVALPSIRAGADPPGTPDGQLIDRFEAERVQGRQVAFRWRVSRVCGQRVTCILDPGDDRTSRYHLPACTGVESHRHRYSRAGTFRATLIAWVRGCGRDRRSARVVTRHGAVVDVVFRAPAHGVGWRFSPRSHTSSLEERQTR